MMEVLKLFAQIALLRRGPQDLPASGLLLGGTVIAYLAVNCVAASVVPAPGNWPLLLLVDVAFLLAWNALLLQAARRPERTVQTLTAVFGYQLALAPLLLVLQSLAPPLHGGVWAAPVETAGLVCLVWLVAANTRIVSAALEWSFSASAVLVILQTLADQLLQSALLVPAKN